MRIARVPGDGDCLFAAFACVIGSTPHDVRRVAIEHMRATPRFWKRLTAPPLELEDARRLVTQGAAVNVVRRALAYPAHGSIEAYLALMSRPGAWGGHAELAALSAAYGVKVVIVTNGSRYVAAGDRFRTRVTLLYDGAHYDAVV